MRWTVGQPFGTRRTRGTFCWLPWSFGFPIRRKIWLEAIAVIEEYQEYGRCTAYGFEPGWVRVAAFAQDGEVLEDRR